MPAAPATTAVRTPRTATTPKALRSGAKVSCPKSPDWRTTRGFPSALPLASKKASDAAPMLGSSTA